MCSQGLDKVAKDMPEAKRNLEHAPTLVGQFWASGAGEAAAGGGHCGG